MKRTVIIGAGQLGKYLLSFLNCDKYKILAIADNNPEKFDNHSCPPIVSVEKALKLNPDVVWIAMKGDERIAQIKEQLEGMQYCGEIEMAAKIEADFDLRSLVLKRLAMRLKESGISGAMAELGVYKGDFAKQMQAVLPDRKIYLFDTFEGFAQTDIDEEKNTSATIARVSDFADTSVAEVLGKMPDKDNVIIRKGVFPKTTENLQEHYALVSLDADLYAPTLAGLRYFHANLVHGGVIIIHDYESQQYPGVKQAVADYEKEAGKLLLIPLGDMHGTVIVVGESS